MTALTFTELYYAIGHCLDEIKAGRNVAANTARKDALLAQLQNIAAEPGETLALL